MSNDEAEAIATIVIPRQNQLFKNKQLIDIAILNDSAKKLLLPIASLPFSIIQFTNEIGSL